ncbi:MULTISPECIES: heavy metal translocating P-type ATPase [Clostridioides]|uniref:heavy metal translocating P-type ATPase n=1 Tax=Clostridioides sp. ZZV14-6387 TaxID=2811497 RepID=UPI0007BB2074|nr:heavy metal translocating P-type ATPase [Clostridioides sp. ZZV14-6387]CZR95823.1 putative copper-exporting P-type ATPase V [Clostridioides difficile]CZS06441.1 putative copper-exporting P-type ATPase V [Clostridioides difficile]
MNFYIKHEIRGRIRFDLQLGKLNSKQSDTLLYYLTSINGITKAKVYDRTGDAVVYYTGEREYIITEITKFSFNNSKIESLVPEHTSRELNNYYRDKLVNKLLVKSVSKIFFPKSLRFFLIGFHSIKYFKKGISSLLNKKIEISVLDATAIGISIFRKDVNTAGSVMFLLGIGELLEEWTRKKSIDDLAQSMSLNIEKVWLKKDDTEILVPISEIKEDDLVSVNMGTMIPLDGVIVSGEAMVNQASLTGESLAINKREGSYIYAGTVIEQGNIVMCVKEKAGTTRFQKIVTMIEESEKLKSSVESKFEHLADTLVPYSFLGSILTYAITRNPIKALSILMVDFSCALKLSIPISVLSAMRECNNHNITVKGGKFLEGVACADTIVFDKTGTLTKAQPTVSDIITFQDYNKKEMLRLAACLEEHFPHSIANAVVYEAEKQGLSHKEMHTEVEYIIAHGISTKVDNKKVIIGSKHFVFEDEKCTIPDGEDDKYNNLSDEYSHLFMAISGKLSAVICINDPLREEAKYVISNLKEYGIKKIVMMTGDSEKTAKSIASKIGVDEYYSEVLPEDKANFVKNEKLNGRKVIMIGDGINDSPAISESDVGIAMSEGAEIAREISDITISADNLNNLIVLKQISDKLMKRIDLSSKFIIGFNLGLILLGVGGFVRPSTSAFLHNASTVGISLKSMTNLLEDSNSYNYN